MALAGGFQTLHLIGHYDEKGSVGLCRSGTLRRELLIKCLMDADIHELVLYGCWAGICRLMCRSLTIQTDVHVIDDAGTSAKLYWQLAQQHKYDLSVVGIGDTVHMMEKDANVSLTAVQLNAQQIDEADDDMPPNSLMSISVSSCKHTCQAHT